MTFCIQFKYINLTFRPNCVFERRYNRCVVYISTQSSITNPRAFLILLLRGAGKRPLPEAAGGLFTRLKGEIKLKMLGAFQHFTHFWLLKTETGQ